jgi:hypothetical protein
MSPSRSSHSGSERPSRAAQRWVRARRVRAKSGASGPCRRSPPASGGAREEQFLRRGGLRGSRPRARAVARSCRTGAVPPARCAGKADSCKPGAATSCRRSGVWMGRPSVSTNRPSCGSIRRPSRPLPPPLARGRSCSAQPRSRRASSAGPGRAEASTVTCGGKWRGRKTRCRSASPPRTWFRPSSTSSDAAFRTVCASQSGRASRSLSGSAGMSSVMPKRTLNSPSSGAGSRPATSCPAWPRSSAGRGRMDDDG